LDRCPRVTGKVISTLEPVLPGVDRSKPERLQ